MFLPDTDQVEVRRCRRIKNNANCTVKMRGDAGAGHGHPLLSGGVAHGVGWYAGRIRAVLEEDETIAGTQELYVLHLGLLRQEGEGRVHERRRSPRQADEAPVGSSSVAAEEAF